jgi:hypothetical protein
LLLVAVATALGLWRFFGENPFAPNQAKEEIGDVPVVAPAERGKLAVAAETGAPRWTTGDFDLFRAKRWTAPAPPPKPVEPAAPVAPPMPFAFSGSMGEDDKKIYFLTKGQDSFQVAIGDAIDDKYRLEGIEGSKLVVIYLPMQLKQYLPMSASP